LIRCPSCKKIGSEVEQLDNRMYCGNNKCRVNLYWKFDKGNLNC